MAARNRSTGEKHEQAHAGPWVVFGHFHNVVVPENDAKKCYGAHTDPVLDREQFATIIATCDNQMRRTKPEERKANARLIAAAPELLHACLLVAENAPIIAEWIKENDATAFAQITAAIAKAKGEA